MRNTVHTRAATRRGQANFRTWWYVRDGWSWDIGTGSRKFATVDDELTASAIVGRHNGEMLDLSARKTNTNVHRKKPKTKRC